MRERHIAAKSSMSGSTHPPADVGLSTRYATTLDKNYIARALCLYDSWHDAVPSGDFGFYCMDQESVLVLKRLGLERALIVPHDQFATNELRATRPTRSMAEYCWSSKPAILRHSLQDRPDLDWVIYLDSDMMFFGNANRALDRDMDYLVTPHRFSPEFEAYRASVGSYNAGYVAFRNSAVGREALGWWMMRCLEWCGSVPASDKYADQKYLDDLPGLFGSAVPEIKGLNAAPWNIDNYTVATRDGQVEVDGEALLLFHFQGFRIHGRSLHDMYSGNRRLKGEVVKHIYHPYVRRLAKSIDRVRRAGGDPRWGIDSFVRRPRLFYQHGRKLLRGTSNLTFLAA
jgi:hypothetical protein